MTVGISPDSEYLQALTTGPWFFDEVIAVLGKYSLVQRNVQTNTLSLHRLVQAVLQDRLSEQERKKWLTRIFPEVEYATWSQCKQLLLHALQCIKHIPLWEQPNENLVVLLLKTERYLRERAHYREAETSLKRARHIRELALHARPLRWDAGQSHLNGRACSAHLHSRALKAGLL